MKYGIPTFSKSILVCFWDSILAVPTGILIKSKPALIAIHYFSILYQALGDVPMPRFLQLVNREEIATQFFSLTRVPDEAQTLL